jgi:cytoskeletal protein RodZ
MKWLRRKKDTQPTPSIEQQQIEKLTEMGGQLLATRQEKGLSLDDMVVLTKIPRRLLLAIEEGNLNNLPEPIYIQGLVRQFADALDFNGVEFASAFPVGSNRVSLKPAWKNAQVGHLRPLHLYLLYVGLIVCSVSGLSNLLNNATLQANNNQTKPRVDGQFGKSKTKQAPEYQSVGQTLSTTQDGKEVQINVTLTKKSWIRVVADGKTVFENELPEGTQRTWKAQSQLAVKAGNAGGVMVSVNRQEPKPMGNPDEVKEVKIASKPNF